MTTRQQQPEQPEQPAAPTTAAEYAQAQREEWTQYVAAFPIDYYGVRAYNAGDPVPASAVGDDPAQGRWVPEHLVQRLEGDAAPFEGSQTVVDPAPPTVDEATVAAPVAASPTPITTTEG